MKRSQNPVQRREVLNDITSSVSIDASGKRRGFLYQTAGLLLGAFGFSRRSSGSPATNATAKRVAANYSTPEQVRRLVQEHAGELILGLGNEGYLESGSPSQLPLERIHPSVESYTDALDGVLVSASPNATEPNVRIHVKFRGIDGQELVVQIAPQSGLSRVVTGPGEEGEVAVLVPKTDASGDVGLMGCETCNEPFDYKCGEECTLSNCGCVKYAVRNYSDCIDPDCGGCFVSDYSCCGSYSCS